MEDLQEIILGLLDYVQLLVGLFFLFSLFFPSPLYLLSKYLNFEKLFLEYYMNFFLAIPLVLIVAFLFALTRMIFLKNFAISTLNFILDFIICIPVFIFVMIVITILKAELTRITPQISGFITFLGVFFTVIAIRNLKRSSEEY